MSMKIQKRKLMRALKPAMNFMERARIAQALIYGGTVELMTACKKMNLGYEIITKYYCMDDGDPCGVLCIYGSKGKTVKLPFSCCGIDADIATMKIYDSGPIV